MKILHSNFGKYEAFNVMMTRHIKTVTIFYDKNLRYTCKLALKTQSLLWNTQHDIFKEILIKQFSVKELNILASDLMNYERQTMIAKYVKRNQYEKNYSYLDYIKRKRLNSNALSTMDDSKQDSIQNINQDYLAAYNISFDKTNFDNIINTCNHLDDIIKIISNDIKLARIELQRWYINARTVKEKFIKIKDEIKSLETMITNTTQDYERIGIILNVIHDLKQEIKLMSNALKSPNEYKLAKALSNVLYGRC